MSLQIDFQTGKITYRGKDVGKRTVEDGRSIVRLNIEYDGGDDWFLPLSWFAYELSKLPENRPVPALLTVRTTERSIRDKFDVMRFLGEKLVKRSGYIWNFHKTDADGWPSLLHGHDYDKGLKLDAITGNIYDVGTRQLCKNLNLKDLTYVQAQLRDSKDFKDSVASLIDKAS